MNALAEELNSSLGGTAALRLLSDMGKRMYFPKGILAQSAEAKAKAKRFNATIGMACEDGQPLVLSAIKEGLPTLSAGEAVAYAPTDGVKALRARWREEMLLKNPGLKGRNFSVPVVAPGLTAAISYVSDLFLNRGDLVVLPELYWPNYRLIMVERKEAEIVTYPTFNAQGGFNIAGLETKLLETGKKQGKAVTVLNFPNNPTGYSPTTKEAAEIVAALKRVAAQGIDLLVICDDAYFGLQYEKGLIAESLFASLAECDERILAVKADGPTKEEFVWGFRIGFVTFSAKGMSDAQYEALVKKLMGVVRSSVSNSSAPVQHLFLKALDAPSRPDEKRKYRGLLADRYAKVRAFVDRTALPPALKVLPFNSGYFMSFECVGISAEKLRLALLDEGIGTISMQDHYLRVAFSSVDAKDVDALYSAIYSAAAALAKA